MTAVVIHMIRCEHRDPIGGGCDAERGWPLPVQHHSELRALLAKQGWTRSRHRDFCPDHGHA